MTARGVIALTLVRHQQFSGSTSSICGCGGACARTGATTASANATAPMSPAIARARRRGKVSNLTAEPVSDWIRALDVAQGSGLSTIEAKDKHAGLE